MTKRIGLLGAGTVGGSLAELIQQRSDVDAVISKVLVQDTSKARNAAIDPSTLTTDSTDMLDNCDILVEVMGGTTLAGDLLLQALAKDIPVVTANKAVLAERWAEFKPYIEAGKVYFEASVMAGTPSIEPIVGSLRGSQALEINAILNGTCNYIIGQLEAGIDYATALKEAQDLGYAEADPTLDVGGFDTAHKLTLLARLTVDPDITWAAVEANTRGVDILTIDDIENAKANDSCVRLVGSVYPEGGKWVTTVRPVVLPNSHSLAKVASNFNALHFKGDAIGEVLITGAGAGGPATASGVLADVIAVLAGRSGPSLLAAAKPVPAGYEAESLKAL